MKPPADRVGANARGIFWSLAAVGLFALIYLSGRLTGDVAAALQIVWLRFVGGTVVMTLWVAASTQPRQLIATPRWPVHAVRALAGGAGGACAIHAATHLPVVTSSAIGLLEGVFSVALGILLLRERVAPAQWLGGGLCLGGAAVIVFSRTPLPPAAAGNAGAALAGLAGALLVSLEIILIKTLARRERAATVLFYVNLFGALILTVPAMLAWRPIPVELIAAFLCLGPLALLGQTCNLIALRHADVALLAPVRYSWILFGALFGYLLFGERPGAPTWIGGAMIIAGGLWLASLRPLPGQPPRQPPRQGPPDVTSPR